MWFFKTHFRFWYYSRVQVSTVAATTFTTSTISISTIAATAATTVAATTTSTSFTISVSTAAIFLFLNSLKISKHKYIFSFYFTKNKTKIKQTQKIKKWKHYQTSPYSIKKKFWIFQSISYYLRLKSIWVNPIIEISPGTIFFSTKYVTSVGLFVCKIIRRKSKIDTHGVSTAA